MAEIATREVTIHSGPGLRLAGRYYLPDDETAHRTGILLCHGFGGVKEGVPPGLARLLAASGYTVLTFDYRGFGGSEGARDRLIPAEQVEDILHALELLALEPGIDPERIGVFASSFAGGLCALAALQSPRPKALVMCAPVTSGSAWLASLARYYEFIELKRRALAAIGRKAVTGENELVDRFDIMIPDPVTRDRVAIKVPITLETFHHVLQHEPIARAHELRLPVLMLGLRQDVLAPFEQTASFYERLTAPKSLHVFEHGSHWSPNEELLPAVAERSIDWFRQHLWPQQR